MNGCSQWREVIYGAGRLWFYCWEAVQAYETVRCLHHDREKNVAIIGGVEKGALEALSKHRCGRAV